MSFTLDHSHLILRSFWFEPGWLAEFSIHDHVGFTDSRFKFGTMVAESFSGTSTTLAPHSIVGPIAFDIRLARQSFRAAPNSMDGLCCRFTGVCKYIHLAEVVLYCGVHSEIDKRSSTMIKAVWRPSPDHSIPIRHWKDRRA